MIDFRDTKSTNEFYPYQDRTVRDIAIHFGYYHDPDSEEVFNDIALLFVSEPFELAPNVNIVCLPNPNDTFSLDSFVRCYVSGWGKDVFGVAGKYQVILKRIEIPMVQRQSCIQSLKTKMGEDFHLHSSFICAGKQNGISSKVKHKILRNQSKMIEKRYNF